MFDLAALGSIEYISGNIGVGIFGAVATEFFWVFLILNFDWFFYKPNIKNMSCLTIKKIKNITVFCVKTLKS